VIVTHQDSLIGVDKTQLATVNGFSQAVTGHSHPSNLWEQWLQLVNERLDGSLHDI